MRIALVYDAIYPYVKGGGEKRFYEIGRQLVQRGHQVHLYGMKFWNEDNIIEKDGLYLHGICRARKLYTKEGRRSILQALYFGLCSLNLIKEHFDVLDCCTFPYFSLFACKLVSVIKRKQLFSTCHEVWGKDYWLEYIGWKGFIGYVVEKFALFLPDRIISVSSHTANKLKNQLNSKKPIDLIPNGIKTEMIKKVNRSKEECEVIFTGRLLTHKNVDVLIKSIHLVKRKLPGIRCSIVGNGPEKESLIDLTNKLNLKNNIRFYDFLDKQEDVFSLIKSSKVLVLPSTREGFGMVVIEANACGVPVITVNSKDNAAKELIKEGKNGFVCLLDEKDISEKLITILSNSTDSKIRKNCINFAAQYEWNRIADAIERVYTGQRQRSDAIAAEDPTIIRIVE
jgi:glycosyltransferase involved in cell wall biosynthesis